MEGLVGAAAAEGAGVEAGAVLAAAADGAGLGGGVGVDAVLETLIGAEPPAFAARAAIFASLSFAILAGSNAPPTTLGCIPSVRPVAALFLAI